MLEAIRSFSFILFLAAGLILEFLSVFGVNRFHYSLNRLHSASIADTIGLLCIVIACVIRSSSIAAAIKFICVYLFMLLTCPISGHLISFLVYRTDPEVEKEAKPWKR